MKSSLVRHAATYGFYVGLILILLDLIAFHLGLRSGKGVSSFLFFTIMIVGIAWASIRYRDKEMGGFIPYSQVIGYGVLLSLFFGVIVAIYLIIRATFIDMEVDMAIPKSGFFFAFLSALFLILLVGVVISLLSGLFIKRDRPPSPFVESENL